MNRENTFPILKILDLDIFRSLPLLCEFSSNSGLGLITFKQNHRVGHHVLIE